MIFSQTIFTIRLFRKAALVLTFALQTTILLFAPFSFFAEELPPLPATESEMANVAATEDLFERSINLHQWSEISLFHGLPSERVYAIAQDKNGIFWFGTERGLARYDGRRVQTVNSNNLPPGSVLTLKLDQENTLWVGTKNGAARFSNDEFVRLEETWGAAVTEILVVPERRSVIVATGTGKIFEYRKNAAQNFTVEQISSDPAVSSNADGRDSLAVTSLATSKNALLIGTHRRGLAELKEVDGEKSLHDLPSRPRTFFINALVKDKKGNLWLGANAKPGESGFYLANNPLKPIKIAGVTGDVSSLSVGENEDVWVGTATNGVFRFRGTEKIDHFTFAGTAGGLRSDTIYDVFVDRENVVWVGTDKGVCRYDPKSPQNEQLSANPQSNFVRTLFRTQSGEILSGTNRGLFVSDQTAENWREIKSLIGKPILTVTQNSIGQIFVGSTTGLYAVDTVADKIERQTSPKNSASNSGLTQTDKSVRAIREFQGATLVASFDYGVERQTNDDSALIFPTETISSPLARQVKSLYAENNERLWIGTAQTGVFIFDGKQILTEPALDALHNNSIWAIDGTKETGIWFATENGLFVFRNGELQSIRSNTQVHHVFVDRSTKNVWAATADGLLRVVFDEEFGYLVSNLDTEQGLLSQKIFVTLPFRDENNREILLIGTSRGIVRYSPSRDAPLLVLTRLLSRRLHPVSEIKTGIKLDYPQNSLALDVTAISSRTFAEQFQYAFLLRDATGQIINKKLTSDAQFLMDDLPPGNYSVEVLAFNQDLQVSEPLKFEFTVDRAPFPWTLTIVSILLVFAVLAVFWGIFERRRIFKTSKQLAAANQELTVAKLKLANYAEGERRRIARYLHDQTLADLRRLLLLTDQLPNGDNANGNSVSANTFRQEIEAVSTEIRQICEDLSPSVLENVGLAAALEWAAQTAAAEGKFAYQFVADEDFEENLKLPLNVQIQIYRIVQEVLNNISRHAAARAVSVEVSSSEKHSLILTIENDGHSFEPRHKREKRGRGIANIQARASLVHAQIAWRKIENSTRFELSISQNSVNSTQS